MKRKKMMQLIGLLVLIIGMPLYADHPDGPAIGVVLGGNFAFSEIGSSVGASFKLPSIPIFWSASLAFSSDSFGFGVTGDKYLIDSNLISEQSFNLDWYLGAGGYLNMGSFGKNTILNIGARVPIGLSWHINKEFELFLSIDPSLGICLAPELRFPDFYCAAELGFRYWMKKK
jgi:hypothetical protein